jgi:hypothetical protein
MDAVTFRAIVSDEQVIRPPAGVALPAGAIEVTVRPIANQTASAPANREAANQRLRQHRASLGQPTGIANDEIDADLARAYGAGLNAP